ncbi:MAG: 2-hydroxyacid dehydrogenase [Proteobacteria bacterium]|nr:2-hydroxyacid dehydrogenase [Burkholderiales bacterium]
MEKPSILFVNTNYAPALATLEAYYTVFNYRDTSDRDALLKQAAPTVQAIFTNEGSWVPSLMEALPLLKLIVLVSNGYESIDVARAQQRGIRITNTPDETTGEVADLAFALMLAAARRMTWAERYVRSGEWKRAGRVPLTRRVHGKKVGIVGLGSIGRAVARRAEGFDMDVCYHGPSRKDGVSPRYYADLEQMAADVDFLAVTCIGGPTTHGIVDAKVLSALGSEGIVVNIARGSCIVEADLIAALRAGTLGGAGIDVYAQEPADPAPFEGLDNIVLTPHYGSGTEDTRRAMNETGFRNLEAFFAGRPLVTPIRETPG